MNARARNTKARGERGKEVQRLVELFCIAAPRQVPSHREVDLLAVEVEMRIAAGELLQQLLDKRPRVLARVEPVERVLGAKLGTAGEVEIRKMDQHGNR